ncbi:hypothetical protein [Parahaliea mediterranea]|uniref:hypothetical protein n=1 Tax=Parahaliea mediterranea TaxID=651086 RepID=UPI0013004246|nr:hypothetical protein [Parahaliea mediterranea]
MKNPPSKLDFVVYAPKFDENSGGAIALHRLCHILRQLGQRAFLWPISKPSPIKHSNLSLKLRECHFLINKFRNGEFYKNPGFDTPTATPETLLNAIAVYPEIINGDPMGCGRCVRWFLHKPGFHTGRIEYGSGDLMFYYQDTFRSNVPNLIDGGLLQTLWVRDDIYHEPETIRFPRSGECHMIRKGAPTRNFHSEQSLKLDGLSHKEIATAFQQREIFYSYDPYTMYSSYAAACGCDSIVVPPAGMSKRDWYQDERKRFGIAFGMDEISWARATRAKALESMRLEEKNAIDSTLRFIEICNSYF